MAANYISKEVQFAGVLLQIPMALDPCSRSEVLKVIDQGKQDKLLFDFPRFQVGVTLHVDVNNIKLISMDNQQEPLLRIPIPQVAAVSYVKDDDQHILCIKFGEVSKMHLRSDALTCNLAVLYCDSHVSAEEICSCVDLCFQAIYTDATMTFFDKSLVEESQAMFQDNNKPGTASKNTLLGTLSHLNSHRRSLGFLSHSNLSLGNAGTSSSGSALSQMTHQSSENEISSAANDLILDYMNKLYTKLSAAELQEFAMLIKSWHSNMAFPDFCEKVLNLYGPERRHLLVGMRPFIPAKDSSYFEHFLELSGCFDEELTVTSFIPGESWEVLGQDHRRRGSFNSLTDGFEMVDHRSTLDETGSNASLDMT